ncbi:MAG: VWA domain-containing protein [Deltaproteobacteria bacterium]|nr:VWA domain-containing protein [Deltaproteobacteria bacterium]
MQGLASRARPAAAPLALGVLALAAGAACTNVSIERVPDPPPPPVDNLVSIKGEFCTESPQNVEFPVKVLFIVDISQSMSQTDPPDPADNNYSARTRAVVDVINTMAGVPGVEIGIISFQSSINDLTRGFIPNYSAADVASLIGFAESLQAQQGQTNFEGALEAGFQVLVTDIAAADETTRGRSRYVVIFVSDGFPNPIDPPDNTPESIVAVVESMQRLERERRLAELKVHTVYLSGRTPPQVQQGPIDLLKDMADAGKGTFRNVGNGEKINFLDIGFTAFRRVFLLKSFLAENRNARPEPFLEAATDSDGDGLSDGEELLIGTSETSTDSDLDGFTDLLENNLRNAGFDPLDGADADCRVTATDRYNRRDDDGDGLLNCEERFLGTNPRLFDTDADGVPDPIEVRARVSPVADDYFADPDRDTVANGFEIRDRTNPQLDDRAHFGELRYRYDVEAYEIRDSQTCFRFFIDNVALVSSTPADPTAEKGWNDLMVVFGQTAADTPTDFGEFRMACVRARFLLEEDLKYPPSGLVELKATDFKKPANLADPSDPAVFNRTRDCVVPP